MSKDPAVGGGGCYGPGPYALSRATRLRRLRCLLVPKRRHRRRAGD